MAANGNSAGQSAASAQAAAAAGNAAASNAANGNGNGGSNSGASTNTSGTTGSTNTSTGNTSTSSGATNSAGLMGSLMSFGNSITGNVGNTYGGSGSGSSDSKSDGGLLSKLGQLYDAFEHAVTPETQRVTARNKLPANVIAKGDEAYTKARSEGKTEAEAQYAARKAVRGEYYGENANNVYNDPTVNAFEGKNTGPTYNPSIAAMANTNKTIAKGSSEMGPSTPATAPASPAANNAPGGNLGGETGGIVSGAAPTNVSDATNTGVTNRGSTVTGGTSVTDSGSGGSISSSITPPSRDASSIGLGVYDNDRANYDQDNWNRGMEVESSSLVSDEECKAFAKRAFMENSEPFKVVRTTILKRC